jgi:hypothetical protein
MGCRRSIRPARRGRSRACLQACKDALIRRPHRRSGAKYRTEGYESRQVQVFRYMRWLSVPGTAPSKCI